MKILFSNPPWWESDGDNIRIGVRAGSRWPFTRASCHYPDEFRFGGYLPYPFFLGHAASYTQMLMPDHNVEMRDSIARGESYRAFAEYLRDNRPDWLVVETATPSWPHDRRWLEFIAQEMPACKVIVCGTLDVKSAPDIMREIPTVAAIVQGEYDKQIARVIKDGERGLIPHALLTRQELDEAPPPMYDEACAYHYWDGCPTGQKAPQLQVWTSRGCPFKCLSGDTPINTVFGMIPIRELVGQSVGVFTYDRNERRALITTSGKIAKTGEMQTLVRVHFDDGSHIDCTPDHKIMVFKWGNQFAPEREWMVEAKDLKAGDRVRAIKQYKSGDYLDTTWNRMGREKTHRLVAEWKIGRRLVVGEVVHHIDGNKLNWSPDNLEVLESAKAHFAKHPEIAERMRRNNPTLAGISGEWRARLGDANRGKVRSAESRERYRKAALKREAAKSFEQRSQQALRGIKTRMQRGDALGNQIHMPDGTFNHRVVCVEELPGLHDTYCMEVPGTHLLYANGVLVSNCGFCVWPAVMTGNDPDGTHSRSVRCMDAEAVRLNIRQRMAIAENAGTPYQSIYIDDDTFNLTEKHTLAISSVMKSIGLPWSAMCRADTISRDAWAYMKECGCFGVKLGFESGNQWVLDNIVNKRLNLEKAVETARYIRSIGMSVHGTFTIGLPGETHEQQEETKAFIKMMHETGALDTHQLSGTAEIEGTPFHTLRSVGHLDKYSGAKIDADYIASPDGQRKIEAMQRKELR